MENLITVGQQDRPLENGSHSNVVIIDSGELLKYVLEVLYMGTKHPVRDKFNELHFIEDVTILLRYIRKDKMAR